MSMRNVAYRNQIGVTLESRCLHVAVTLLPRKENVAFGRRNGSLARGTREHRTTRTKDAVSQTAQRKEERESGQGGEREGERAIQLP